MKRMDIEGCLVDLDPGSPGEAAVGGPGKPGGPWKPTARSGARPRVASEGKNEPIPDGVNETGVVGVGGNRSFVVKDRRAGVPDGGNRIAPGLTPTLWPWTSQVAG